MRPMKLRGTRAVRLLVVVLVAAAGTLAVPAAQTRYPKSVVMLATHSSPGGGSDVFLREMAPHLARVMGVRIIVDNLAGGSGAKAMAVLSKAKPDGGMFYATTPTFVYTSLLSKPAASFRDLEPIVNIFYDPEVLYTATNSAFATLEQVIERARTGKGRWGAANPASLERQVMERLKQKTRVTPVVATFEGGGDMLINVLNHTLDMGIGELQEIRAQLDAGRVRLLAVAGDARLAQYPDVKTVKEHGIDLSVRKFRGIAGPKGTPPGVIAAWEAAIPKLLADPAYKKIYAKNNLLPGFIPHADYVTFMGEFGRQTEAFLKESGVIR
jgi:tripartite-type tricarboxylate transporter receptor subunit TctC